MINNYIYLGTGDRLDVYMAKILPEYTRSYIKRLIDDSRIIVDGQKVKAGYAIKNGMEVTVEQVEMVLPSAQAEDLPLDIVYEDEDVIVVNKAYGMVVHPCNSTKNHTLVNALLHNVKDLSGINGVLRPGIVHRLDKDTSGLMCVAKNDMAHHGLAKQLLDKTMHREYNAILSSGVKDDEFSICTDIARSKRDGKMMSIVPDGEGRRAISHFKVLTRYRAYTLVSVRLETGRTHQIRVHSRHINAPVVGDKIYNTKLDKSNLMLVSKKLCFVHPRTHKKMIFEIEWPKYFSEYIEKLKKSLH